MSSDHQQVVDATASSEASMRPQRVPANIYETSGAFERDPGEPIEGSHVTPVRPSGA